MKRDTELLVLDTWVEEDEFWTTTARFASAGVYEYPKYEFADMPGIEKIIGDTVRVFRPESVVFDAAAMASYERVPITTEHEKGKVTRSNAKGIVIGAAGYPVERVGDKLAVPVTVYDGSVIMDAKTKRRNQLSAGYSATFEYNPGSDPKYGDYHVVMTSWKGNHITVTTKARGGTELTIGDKMSDEVKKVERQHDGVTYVFDSQSAQVFDRVSATAEALRAENDELRSKLEETKKNILDSAAIDKLVDERAEEKATVLDSARKINPDGDFRGTTKQIIMDSVIFAYPKMDLTNRSEDYVRCLFDTAAEHVVTDSSDSSDDIDNNGEPKRAFKRKDKEVHDSKSHMTVDQARDYFIKNLSGRNKEVK